MDRPRARPLLHRPAVLVVGVAALAAAVAWGRATIPAGRVPIHWEGSRPDGWTGRDAFLLVQLPLLAAGVTALLLGVGWLIGRSTSLSGLNVPNREEWARPERQDQAARMLRDAMTGLAGLVLMLLATLPVAVGAAVGRPDQSLPGLPFGLVIVAFVAAVVVWVVGLHRAFGSPEP